ncbi:MAG: VanW family protein [Eubacteriales bacterium]
MKEKRKLFCQLSPLTYKISERKCIAVRHLKNMTSGIRFSSSKSSDKLPVLIYKHGSLIRRRLGNVDSRLQDNKAVNLTLSAPKISGLLIKPGETFSFWRLVGKPTVRKGYKEGLLISNGQMSSGIGGGMCQFTNLLHWMVLHTRLTITEHHHHDGMDLFPDYDRQIPFGTGTSVGYNYLDYRFRNDTDITYQIIVYTTDEYLCGEIRADKLQRYKYHIRAADEFFSREDGTVYRNGKIYRDTINPIDGICVKSELLRVNHARVCYNTDNIDIIDL